MRMLSPDGLIGVKPVSNKNVAKPTTVPSATSVNATQPDRPRIRFAKLISGRFIILTSYAPDCGIESTPCDLTATTLAHTEPTRTPLTI